MARSALGSFLTAVAKDAARRQRLAAQAQARSIREQTRQERERARQARLSVKAQKEAAREAKQQYIEDQIASAEEKSEGQCHLPYRVLMPSTLETVLSEQLRLALCPAFPII